MKQLKQSTKLTPQTTAVSLFVQEPNDPSQGPTLLLHVMNTFRPGSLSHEMSMERAGELAAWLQEFATTGKLSED